jgi:P4 family phage/plasmid primase-like protien
MSDHNNSSNSIHISESILIQYYKMGFKLVPIGADGKIPNVNELLTPDEQLISIKESKTGKIEPVTYIYNHPEFWNEERLKKEAHRFKNVATLPGKTHLKTKDGNPLYLNILDIDSEQVFTILSRFTYRNRKDCYFIDKACKSTFVSKTKKKYGRHIFWLSAEEHKPIITNECKPGLEFEIKTRFGLIALPGSRHRDDPNSYYQKVGTDEIRRFDQMYDLLTDILKDCLKPKRDKNANNYAEENKDNSKVDLSDEQIELLFQLISPWYRIGYRHQITYGLSGLMHKHYVAIESTILLIQNLSANDEERDSRLLTLYSTYQKNSKEVSGYQYLISVLENVVDGGRAYARSVLRKIMDIISVRDNNQDINTILTEQIMTEYSLVTMRDNEEMYYYNAASGVYLKFGDSIIKEYLEILNPKIKSYTVNEIIQKIKRRTYVDRDQFDNNTDLINVQNGILNIWTGKLSQHSPDFLTIVQLPIIYNPISKCPAILKFLGQVLHPLDVFTAMEIIGYLLYKTAVYEKAVMLYGNGDNGKSVFIKLIESFVGPDNCSHVPLQDLDNDKFSSADLYGKLVNTFADLKSQKLLATGNFKTLVSGDSVRAQKKYGQPFSFRNKAKMIFSSNKIPDSDDKSHAYYKRWLILSFGKVFQGATRDPNLIGKLTTPEELSGLLNLALIALRQLKKDGGFRDISVERVRKEYEYNSNTVKAFLDDRCVIDLAAPEYNIPTVYLYNAYENFCQEKRVRALEVNVFGSKLKEYGIEKDRIRNHGDREYYYFGVTLRKDLRGQNQSLFNN